MPDRTTAPLCGSGVILYLDKEQGQLIVVPARCHRWDCSYCAQVRVLAARAKAAAGKPERLITLTTRPRPGMSLDEGIRWIRDRWKRLLERLRRNSLGLEYMAFVELHKSGWPHMHILTRGCYIPRRMLRAWWQELTASHGVYIQQIKNGWKGVNEATKYYLKTAQQVHEAAPRLPVYTLSRKWLPPEWQDGDRPPGNYEFYAYVRMPWAEFHEELENLGLNLTPVPDSPGRYVIEFTGPPDPETCDMHYKLGSFAQMDLTAALQGFWSQYVNGPHDFAQAKAACEIYSSMDECPV